MRVAAVPGAVVENMILSIDLSILLRYTCCTPASNSHFVVDSQTMEVFE